ATLDALAELHARDRLFDLVLVGSDKGQEARFSREVRRRGLDSHVRILGFVTTEELIELYRSAHALLFLSRFGPENLPPLEAMALGCPAVVADVPGAREQYGDAALIVDPRSPGEVADALESLDEPPVRDRLVAQGLSRARSWTARDYVQGVLSFLDEFEIERRLWSA
ncbi:MAG: glycosyltransferase, partial [Gaiellaceae bacterium]